MITTGSLKSDIISKPLVVEEFLEMFPDKKGLNIYKVISFVKLPFYHAGTKKPKNNALLLFSFFFKLSISY